MEERIFVLFSTEECLLQETVGGKKRTWDIVSAYEHMVIHDQYAIFIILYPKSEYRTGTRTPHFELYMCTVEWCDVCNFSNIASLYREGDMTWPVLFDLFNTS